MLDRAQKRRRREGRVHHERQMVLSRDGRVSFDVGDVKSRVADGLDEEKPSLLVDRGLDGGEVVHRREVHLDAGVREDCVELAERAAVEVVRRDDLVSDAGDVRYREVDGRRARRQGSLFAFAPARCLGSQALTLTCAGGVVSKVNL